MHKPYDYIIVGAGAAGCVLAARLSEDPHVRVLLIEAGGSDRGLVTRVPLLTFLASANAKRNWSFETEPIPMLQGRRQIWNQGRLIGGSSSINGMIYMRGQPQEYSSWEQVAGKQWSFQALLPFFKKSECNSRGEGPWHGGAGPMKVRPSRLNLAICEAFLEAIRSAGYPLVEDLNAGVSEGFGRFDCNIERGIRVSAASAYLHPAYSRNNLKVLENALALRICVEHGRARGVEVLHRGKRNTLFASSEIILCGGALNSPALLMASGIGPAAHLTEVGIPTIFDSPEVGENLRNHPAYIQRYLFRAAAAERNELSLGASVRAFVTYAQRRTGPFAESFSSVGGYFRSDSSESYADAIVLIIPSLLQRAGGGRLRWNELFPKERGFSIVIALGRPRSSGQIRLSSATLGVAPRIFPNYFHDGRDMSALVGAVQAMRRVVRQDCIAKSIDVSRDNEAFEDDVGKIEQSIRATAGSLSHPMGSCRMGFDARAVVDPQLQVNGIAGLRVADNSIAPGIVNACTHALALMIGEKASSLIKGAS